MKTTSACFIAQLCLILCLLIISTNARSAVMNDYCVQPPFIAATVPPLVMFEMGRDHKLYYESYSDSADLDEDGILDITYKHSIDYYGYFDPYKCYQYNTVGTDKFDPVSHTTTKFCSNAGGQWSGNILNWLTMSRIDVLKKVLYGGHRSADSTSETVLERATIPQDAHSWGKEFTGRLCYNATGTPQYTYSCSIDSDCAAGYACTDKSMELVGFAQAGLSTCSASTPGTTNNKMLVVRYKHPAGLTAAQGAGDTHTDLLASYADATEPLTATFLDYDIAVTNFGTSGSKIDPTQNHLDSYSTMVVAEFKTSSGSGSETWQFMVDSDDGAEVEIFTTATTPTSLGVIASHYGAHSSCSTAPTTACSGMVTGSISLSKSSTWYRLVVRASEVSGQDGVRVWYKNPSKTSWTLFGTTNLGNNNMRTFDITSSNQCTLYASEFINKGKPTSGATSQDSSKFHMVCNTTLSATGAPLMRLLQNVSGKRIWDWASKERPVCDTSLGTPTDYDVRVKVCDSTIDTADQLDIKKSEIGDSCKWYPGSGSGLWKPVGLLQQYGEGDGSKVCSKSMSKACATDAGCTFATEGKCVDKADMYFGMMTTSYTKNTSGGVLRKNIGAILDESNANNGIFQSSENSQGNIILTFDRLKPVGFQYSDWSYQDSTGGSCGWITDRPIAEGECRSWGNPIAEMMYESLRYYAGRLTPTSDFTYSASQDSGLSLSKPDWGYKDGSTAKALYEIYPSCAKPFILLLSDTNTSYDSDQIPGSSFKKPDGTSFAEDTPVLLKLGETQSSGRSLLNELSYTIGQTENIHGNSWYIGENGTLKDFLCTGKTASNFSLLRGMCPEEPTKMGSYYSAALAYYGKAKFKSITGKPDVNTFVVALSSPFSDLQIKTGSGIISILPTAKSVSGCSNAYAGCSQRMNLTYDATYGLRLNQKSPADSAAYCPTNTIVDYYVDDIRYDSSNNVTYALFRINYEDVEQGADHDMDSIVKYEICTATAATNGYGSCGTSSLAANQIEVKLVSDYAAGCIDQVMGFVISGTTEDGVYLPVKDADVGSSDSDTPAVVADMPLTWSKEFTIGATSAAKSLKNPLWYAAKWGGFEDKNGNNVPDQREEWAKDCTATDVSQCNPDNYYQVVNPLKLRRQLNKALTDILRRVTSGTAASILNNSEGSGANLLQAVFYPAKSFDSNTETQWIGEMQNLWYFLDPALQKTSIREDSNQNNSLNLKNDKVAQFYFDASENKTLVKLFSDANGDGAADSSTPDSTVTPDEVKSLWKAGRMLWERNVSADPRTIYTGYNSTLGNTPQKFSNLPVDGYFNTWPNTWSILQIPAGTNAEREALATKLISFTHGSDQVNDTAPCLNSDCKYRSRKVTLLNCNTGSNSGRVPDGVCNREWKLGDIISSTPKLISNVPLNQYDLSTPRGYNDTSYKSFTESNTYKHRGMALVGGNDGMLHAFKLGVLKELKTKFDKAQMNDASDNLADASDKLGREEWAFIPKNSLPYLRYLSETGYNHLYYVDRTPTIFDASIGKPAGCGTDYSDCSKLNDGTTWRTIVIGGMGIGGASRDTANACSTSTDCVKNPLAGNGYSSYFALDVTDPATPKYLWEFAGDPASLGSLGYSTTGPAIVRIAKKDASGHPDNTKNGKWFAVFASGPTGPIDTTAHQFKGQSDQNLKLFIVDIGTGALVKTIDTGLANAFAGSLASSWIDADRSNTTSNGFYSDDAIYIGYVQKDTSVTPNTWTKGGVLRLLTRESDDPASSTATKQWSLSTLISGTGPVTTSVTKLQDRNNKTLWVYFGTGRFFYKADDPTTGTNQKLYGVKEPCYSTATRTMTSVVAGGTTNDLDQNCSDAVPSGIVDQSGNATTAPASTLSASAPGWLISLDAADSSALSERVITDSVASSAGAVFFTTFKPSADICKFGGDSLIWAVNYATGGLPPAKSMQGKALMQVSTGAFAEISLSEAFNSATGNKREHGRRLNTPISGVPPTAQGLSVITNPPPVKKFLHVREK